MKHSGSSEEAPTAHKTTNTKIKTTDLKVVPGDEFTLSDRPTKVGSLFKSKDC